MKDRGGHNCGIKLPSKYDEELRIFLGKNGKEKEESWA